MKFRILRELRSGRRVDVPHPLMPGVDGCYMHADSAEQALTNLRALRGDTRGLVAIPEVN